MRLYTALAISVLLLACNKKPTSSATAASASAAAKAAPPAKVEVTLPAAVKLEAVKPFEIGGKKIAAEVCKLDKRGAEMKSEDFSGAIGDVVQAADGTLFVLDHEGKLRHYRVQGASPCELALDDKFGQGGALAMNSDPREAKDYNTLAVDRAGALYVSGFGKAVNRVTADGKIAPACGSETGKLHIDATTGDAYFESSWGKKIKIDGDKCVVGTEEPKFEGFEDKPTTRKTKRTPSKPAPSKPTPIDAGGGMVFAFGYVDKVSKVGVYKHDGTKLALLGEQKGDAEICNQNAVTPCGLGICVLDGNCRSLRVWSTDGKFVGKGDLDDNFVGNGYIWPIGLFIAKDVAWMTFTVDQTTEPAKDQKKQSYGFIARVTGLN